MKITRCDKCGCESSGGLFEPRIGAYCSVRSGVYHLCQQCGDTLNGIIARWLRGLK